MAELGLIQTARLEDCNLTEKNDGLLELVVALNVVITPLNI
jgi:hypothetical protein